MFTILCWSNWMRIYFIQFNSNVRIAYIRIIQLIVVNCLFLPSSIAFFHTHTRAYRHQMRFLLYVFLFCLSWQPLHVGLFTTNHHYVYAVFVLCYFICDYSTTKRRWRTLDGQKAENQCSHICIFPLDTEAIKMKSKAFFSKLPREWRELKGKTMRGCAPHICISHTHKSDDTNLNIYKHWVLD